MAVKLSPIGNDAPFVDANGDPLSGGLLYVYLAGSATPATTYQDDGGTTPNANPIVLNSNGYPASGGSVVEIWLTTGASYLFTLKTSAGVTVWSRDDIMAINDTSVSIDQWVAGPTPTYVSATSFTLVGDQTSTFQVGRRLKTTNSGGTIYSTITASAYGALTTVTVVNDSGSLDAGLSAVYYGLLSPTSPSTPLLADTYPIVSGSADKTKKLRFELDGLTTATTRVLTPPNADLTLPDAATLGTVPMTSATGVLSMAAALSKTIYGLAYANNAGDATNDIDFPVGGCMDSTGAAWLACAAMTKQLDAGWAAGTNQGMRNSGAAIANTDYYLYAVGTATGGSQDYYAHTSTTVATVLAALQAESGGSAYVYARLIGWIKRVGGTIVAFHTYETEGGGIEQNWDVPTLDINLVDTLTTSRRTDAVKVPLNFSTIAHLSVEQKDSSATALTWICCPDQTDAAPADGAAPLFNIGSVSNYAPGLPMKIRTSATGTIAARSSIATVDLYAVSTIGFLWSRRT